MLENFTKRNNLIFKGLTVEKGAEKSTIEKFCKDVLDKDVTNCIQDAYAVGKKYPAIKVECDSKKTVMEILRKSGKLKGTGYYIDRDFAWQTRMKRKNMFLFRKELLQKNPNLKVRILTDSMLIKGEEIQL